MGTVPSSFFGYQQKTAVQPICIDQNSGQIHQLNRDDQPIAIRRRLNSALECVGGRLKLSTSTNNRRRKTTESSNSSRRLSNSAQQKIEQTQQQLNNLFLSNNNDKQQFYFEDFKIPNKFNNLNIIKKNEEENIFKKISNSKKEKNQFNLASEENLDQTTSTLERHKENNNYLLLTNNNNTIPNNLYQKENKCDDNNDVEILINVKNEENKSDFIENKNITLELISQQPSTSFLPKLSPIRNRLWTAPILEDKKIIQQQQHCKAIFKSARGIKKEIPSLLIDLDSICFNEDLIDKKEENEEKINNSFS